MPPDFVRNESAGSGVSGLNSMGAGDSMTESMMQLVGLGLIEKETNETNETTDASHASGLIGEFLLLLSRFDFRR